MKLNFSLWLGVLLFLSVTGVVLQLISLFSESGERHQTSGFEYKAMNSAQMDLLGFTSVAKEEGIEPNDKGEYSFPKEVVSKIAKEAMIGRTIQAVEADGGWSFVSVTADNYFIFRRSK